MADNPEEPKPREDGWDHLPVDLKLRCLEGLGFKDIFLARSYCKFDRSLIDETFNFTFESVTVKDGHLDFQLPNDDKYTVKFPSENMSKIAGILAYIFNNWEIDKFHFEDNKDSMFWQELDKLLDPEKSLKIKNFSYQHSKALFQTIPFSLLQKLNEENLEKLELNFDHDLVPFDQLFRIPAVVNCRNVTFRNPFLLHVRFFIDGMIEHLMKIGTKLHIELQDDSEKEVKLLFERYNCRKIWNDRHNMQICTNLDTAQMFIHHQNSEGWKALYVTIIALGTDLRPLKNPPDPRPILERIRSQNSHRGAQFAEQIIRELQALDPNRFAFLGPNPHRPAHPEPMTPLHLARAQLAELVIRDLLARDFQARNRPAHPELNAPLDEE